MLGVDGEEVATVERSFNALLEDGELVGAAYHGGTDVAVVVADGGALVAFTVGEGDARRLFSLDVPAVVFGEGGDRLTIRHPGVEVEPQSVDVATVEKDAAGRTVVRRHGYALPKGARRP